ncbi:MAG: hypothetical protein M1828_003262 [Chrysothrix sp. TS-e1954]|nr:MAG: hypothetical protein M1828_003262 [Chrysothrix sp. TS-e1954]
MAEIERGLGQNKLATFSDSQDAANTSPDTFVEGSEWAAATLQTHCHNTVTNVSVQSSGPAPDGGAAWLQVFYAHLIVFQTWGYASSFGVFQTYYEDIWGIEESVISWIGTIQVFLILFLGMFSGRAADAGYFRPVFALGCALQITGVMTTSVCRTYWQALLAQGICTGLGNGLLFTPSLSLVSTYFMKKRTLAIALYATGAATGGAIFPAVVREALPRIGFGWTLRAIGFAMLLVSIVAFLGLKWRLLPRNSGPLVDMSALKEPAYALLCVGMFLVFWSLYFAIFYIGSFAENRDGFSYTDSINLIITINIVGVPGRIVPALISDNYLGPLNTLMPTVLIAAVLLFAWTGIHTSTSTYVFAAIYGLPSAGIQTLWPTALALFAKDLKQTGTRIGMGYSIVSFAALTGSPLGGALVSIDKENYLYAQCWAGSSMVLGVAFIIAARFCKTGWVLRRKL